METSKPQFQKYLFVCENDRETGQCCGPAGGRLRDLLKEAVKAKGWSSRVRVSRSGCQDACAQGPNVLLMPDNIWFERVGEKDVEKILQSVGP